MRDPRMDEYLAAQPEPKRSTLRTMRERIHGLYPEVEECFSYGVPAFRVEGIVVAGMAARKHGCSYYPMSGSVLDGFDVEGLGFTRTSGALHLPKDQPLSVTLLRQLIQAKLATAR